MRSTTDFLLAASPIRMISQVDPVKGADNKNMACGQNAQPASMTVPANSGSNVQISWINGNGGNVRAMAFRCHRVAHNVYSGRTTLVPF